MQAVIPALRCAVDLPATLALQLALTRLAGHYGIGQVAGTQAPRAAAVRHWGSDDYRPLFEMPAE